MSVALYGTGTTVKTELMINGVWTDLSTRVRASDAVLITRGTASAQARLTAQTANFTLNNKDGLFTNDNPRSIYYGLLPRNTPIRFTAGGGDAYVRYPLDCQFLITDRVSTPDLAALDVVGDLELRLDITPTSWRPRSSMVLASKWNVGGNARSWALVLSATGKLSFQWTTDGTIATRVTANSTAAVPTTQRRMSIKIVLDVVNGANNSVDFSVSTTGIDGTYTAVGSQVVNSGTTSIFSGSANLDLGQGDDSTIIFGGTDAYRGKIHKFRMYNGIAGTVVANPDFTTQTYGAASFVDSATRVWTIGGACRITSDRIRFTGELTAPPVESDVSGTDVFCKSTASGVIRRLTQGSSPLDSPLLNELKSRSLTGGWMLEDGQLSTQAASFVTGGRPAQTNNMNFAADATLPGAATTATFIDQTSKFIAVPLTTAITGTAYFTFYFKAATLPGGSSTLVTLNTNGTARQIKIGMSSTGFTFDFFDGGGTNISSGPASFGATGSPLGQWFAMNLLLTPGTTGTFNWQARWENVTTQVFVGVGPTNVMGVPGRFTNVLLAASSSSAYAGMAFSGIHTATNDLNFVSSIMAQVANAYFGERAGTRMARLALAQNVKLEITGDSTQTETMGYQTIDTFMNQIYDCADADQGILGEARDTLALTYRTRYDLPHRLDATINYHTLYHLNQVPKATYDDLGILNDVTVNRTKGSSGQKAITSGGMSVNAPPAGIGRYDTEVTRNVSSDARLPEIASWMANQGSTPGARYPNIGVGFHRTEIVSNDTLLQSLISLELGDTAVMTSLPSWLPPDDIYMLVRGYTERLDKFLWDITLNTTPASALAVGRWDYTTELGQSRWGHASSTLSTAINTTATTIVLALNSTTPFTLDSWTTNAASYPFDIVLAGERITLTQVPTGTDPQTFANCVRSVNGIVKSHVVGERAQLFQVSVWGLSY